MTLTKVPGDSLVNLKTSRVEALSDGDRIAPKEIVLRITARYRAFGLYETAILGMLAQSTGWATAARECVEAAAPLPVISFGARHVHPDVTDVLDYAAIVGGCVGASTPAGEAPCQQLRFIVDGQVAYDGQSYGAVSCMYFPAHTPYAATSSPRAPVCA